MLNSIALLPIQTTSRDDAVLNALVDFVAREGLRPGDRLPTERILAERLKVSRNTVREALTRWEGLGLVERRQGSGTYLKAAVSPRHAAHAADARRRQRFHRPDADAGNTPCAWRPKRRRFAPCAPARQTSPSSRDKLEAMEQAFHARAGMSAEEDWEFHQSIYRASGNPLFEQIIAAMHEHVPSLLGASARRARFRPCQLSLSPHHLRTHCRPRRRGARAEALKLIATVEADLKRGAANLKLADRT